MRDYQHSIDQDFIADRLERFQTRRREVLWRRIRQDEVDIGFLSMNALQAHFDAVCCAWALEEDEVLGECRNLMSELVDVVLGYPDQAIQSHIGYGQLAMAGLCDSKAGLVGLAESLIGRTHEDPEGTATSAATHWLTDSMVSLITGDDPTSRQAADHAATELDSPATPPGDPAVPMPHAIRAVLDGDESALAETAADSIERFVAVNAPTATQRAAPNSLVHASLSLLGRTAGWRELSMPPSPYIVPMTD